MAEGLVLIVGGTAGIGRELAAHYRDRGSPVILTGRDQSRCTEVAEAVGEGVSGLAFDLTRPETIEAALAELGPVSRLVLAAISRDNNPVRAYDIAKAVELTTMKLVGYT